MGVFVVSFLSATLLPGISEAALVGLVASGAFRPKPLFFAATIGNWLGSVLTFATGWLGSEWLAGILGFEGGVPPDIKSWIDSYGCLCGLLVWAPWVGDFLALGLGLAKTPIVTTCVMILIGKAVRYAVILGLTTVISDAIRAAVRKKNNT